MMPRSTRSTALAHDRVEDAVLDEAGHLALDHRVVADPLDQRDRRGDRLLARPLAGDDLDHRDQVRRVRPVQAHHALGVGADLGDLRDRDARGVGGQDGARRRVLLELREELLLELEPLGHRLGHELGALQRRRQVALEADAAALDARRLEPVEHPVGHLDAGLARSSASALTSYSATSMPARASTAPMPGPIVPVPITAARFTSPCALLS